MFACSGQKSGGSLHDSWRSCVLVLIFVLSLFMSGCPLGAVVALFAKKDPMVPVAAEYELQAERLLVLVDAPMERTGLSGIRPLLTRQLYDEISRHSLVGGVVAAGELATLRISAENFSELSTGEIGRRLFADQVLRVEVIEFRLGTLVDKPAGQGVALVRVSVFDVQEECRAWPKDKHLGREVLVQTAFREPSGQDYRQEFTEDLCERTAESVIKLFREHEEPRQPRDE